MLARGEYCAYQFDDDVWTASCLSSLVGALDANPNCGVAYGTALCKLKGSEFKLGSEFLYYKLVEGNCIANNALMHRRSMFVLHGGYDVHLAMRRSCDWDLWLRWAKQTRFIHVDEIVSVVDAWQDNSLGKTVEYDPFLQRFMSGRTRDHLLTPDRLGDYEVDSLEPFTSLGPRKIDEIWRIYVAPYFARRRDVMLSPANAVRRLRHVIVTKEHFDSTIDITIGNLTQRLADSFEFSYVPTAQLTASAIDATDVVIFHRTMNHPAPHWMKYAKDAGKACMFLMDDDLLSLHEVSPVFDYIAPGAPCYEIITGLMSQADLVLTYSPVMTESASAHSDCVVELSTNIREKWLKRPLRPAKDDDGPLKIAFAGGGAREEEFAALWPALVEISDRYRDKVEIHFWGFKPQGIDQLKSPFFHEPFTSSYEEYLGRLMSAGFDIMLAPLFAEKRAKRAKCPIKFLEITAAQALGVYSDVEPYNVVEDGRTGFKCANSVDGWTNALARAIDSVAHERSFMVHAARLVVQQRFTSEVQADALRAALDAATLHAILRRPDVRKPRIAFVFHSSYLGGAENHLFRHARISAHYGFEPVIVLPVSSQDSDHEVRRYARERGFDVDFLPLRCETEPLVRELDLDAVDTSVQWLTENEIALVHSVTLLQEVARAARQLDVPHVTSLYAVESSSVEPVLPEHCDAVHSDSLLYANRWAWLLGTPGYCIRSHVPQEFFAEGRSKLDSVDTTRTWRIGLFGTVQARKGQLQAIEALGGLQKEGLNVELDIYGYTQFFPEYVDDCKRMASEYSVSDRVRFHGFRRDVASEFLKLDILLCASDWESLPQVILEAMAAGVLVVAPAVGGIAEVVSDATGVLLRDNSVAEISRGLREACSLSEEQRAARVELAFQVVCAECAGTSVSSALFKLYGDAARARSHAANRNALTTDTTTSLANVSRLRAELARANALLGIESARKHAAALATAVQRQIK